jgi:hypothetical protein
LGAEVGGEQASAPPSASGGRRVKSSSSRATTANLNVGGGGGGGGLVSVVDEGLVPDDFDDDLPTPAVHVHKVYNGPSLQVHEMPVLDQKIGSLNLGAPLEPFTPKSHHATRALDEVGTAQIDRQFSRESLVQSLKVTNSAENDIPSCDITCSSGIGTNGISRNVENSTGPVKTSVGVDCQEIHGVDFEKHSLLKSTVPSFDQARELHQAMLLKYSPRGAASEGQRPFYVADKHIVDYEQSDDRYEGELFEDAGDEDDGAQSETSKQLNKVVLFCSPMCCVYCGAWIVIFLFVFLCVDGKHRTYCGRIESVAN